MRRSAANLIAARLPIIVIGSTLLIFAIGILIVTARLRDRLQSSLIRNESEILVSLTTMLEHEVAEQLGAELLHDDTAQLNILLKSTRLKGFLAARLFTAQGEFVSAFPLAARDGNLTPADRSQIQAGRPVSRYSARMQLEKILLQTRESAAPPPIPALEIIVPLRLPETTNSFAIAQYYLDAAPLARRFRQLDRELLQQAGTVFLLGGILIAGSLQWVFARLQRSRRLVAERTRSLLQANRELALAGRTSAVGTLATHLLHELKSHLFGVRSVLSSREVAATPGGRAALDSSNRMQSLVKELLEVIRNEDGSSTHYEVAARGILDEAAAQVQPHAATRNVPINVVADTGHVVNNRSANLIGIILGHLLQNAVQASPRGCPVRLECRAVHGNLLFRVIDGGPGFPEEMRPWLFKPCNSTKEGGTGIGLALCRQLAAHIRAELKLAASSRNGCIFELFLPPAEFTASTPDSLSEPLLTEAALE